jgi:nucleoside-diphosphate-sugar epimerase
MVDTASAPNRLPGSGSLLVTGATGFLGGVLVRRLLADGIAPERLRCLVRDPARAARGGLPTESLVHADLGAHDCGAAIAEAARGADLVVHLAGSLKAYDRAGFDEVNVHGTERLVAAVREAAPRAHFVHVSSLAAAGPSVDGAGSDRPAAECRTVSRYGESKRRGELAVVGSGMAFTVLRPPVVYGPDDGATQLLFRQVLAPLTAVPRGPRPLSVIHADDVAEALWLAVCRRPAGAFLPLDGPERTDTHAFLRAIGAACDRPPRLLPVPMAVAGLAARASDLWARLRRTPGYFNRDKVREIAAPGWVADGGPARRLLGFSAGTRLADGLRAVAVAEGFAAR